MANEILLYWPEYESIALSVADKADMDCGALHIHHFPDGESLIRIDHGVKNKTVFLFASMAPPNDKLTEFILAATTARDLGAHRVVIVAPYLGYLRQDIRFHAGESVSAEIIADILSTSIDALVTIDPHMHRITDLNDIYHCDTFVLHADQVLADWISANFNRPALFGPDEESEQWVSRVAALCEAPYAVMKKVRMDDDHVSIELPPDMEIFTNRTPILIDDMISTGSTILKAAEKIFKTSGRKPIVAAIHGLFNETTYQTLLDAPIESLHISNSLPGFPASIFLDRLIADFLVEFKFRG